MIVLDTHAWIFWVSTPEHLSAKAKLAIDRAASDNEIYVSSISTWEILALESKERLQLTMAAPDWIARCEVLPFFNFVPVDNAIAVRSFRLPGFPHRDPADRVIVATSLVLGATLVTKDRKIRAYQAVRTLW